MSDYVDKARAEERERCAAWCEMFTNKSPGSWYAERIRALGDGDVAHEQERAGSESTQKDTALQERVASWLQTCFGAEIARDRVERNHRFLEEALELVQACSCTQEEAHQLVDYVFGREAGHPHQEVGAVMITLAALCLANGLDMLQAGEDELARVWTKVEQIRAKQAARPRGSALPQ